MNGKWRRLKVYFKSYQEEYCGDRLLINIQKFHFCVFVENFQASIKFQAETKMSFPSERRQEFIFRKIKLLKRYQVV
jgi:hypothetical protein